MVWAPSSSLEEAPTDEFSPKNEDSRRSGPRFVDRIVGYFEEYREIRRSLALRAGDGFPPQSGRAAKSDLVSKHEERRGRVQDAKKAENRPQTFAPLLGQLDSRVLPCE